MTRAITMLAAIAVAGLLSATPASAWHVEGCVVCEAGIPIPQSGITIKVHMVQGNIDFTVVTDETGCYRVDLPHYDQDYEMYILDLPSGTQVVYPQSGVHYFTLTQGDWIEKFNFRVDSPECPGCWLTGGGVKFDSVMGSMAGQAGPKDSFGGVVFPSCNANPGHGGNVNVVFHGAKLHLKNTDISAVQCGNVDGIEPGSESPVTPYNYLEWQGTGVIVGIKGSKFPETPVTVFGRAEDRNEPGNQNASSGEDIDRLFIRAVDEAGNVYLVDANGQDDGVDPLMITGGNLQLHSSSCSNPPSPFPFF